MTAGRASSLSPEVLHAPIPSARGSGVVVEVMTSTPGAGRVSGVNIEVMTRQAVSEFVELDTLSVDVARAVDPGGIHITASQLAAEALSETPTALYLDQMAVEVLLRAEYDPCVQGPLLGCTTVQVLYRLRVRNADDTDDEFVFTSAPTGANSLIAEPPKVDGATFDPLSGRTTQGGATVLIIDAADGAPSISADPTRRAVTQYLADAAGRSQLLGRRAYLEMGADCDSPEYGDWFPGYVTSIVFVDAITVEIGLAHTTRDDQTSKLWAESTDPYLTTSSYLMGGPVSVAVPSTHANSVRSNNEGLWEATVQAVYDTFVHFDINEDTSGAFPPSDVKPYLRDRGWLRANNDDEQRNVFRWAQANAQKYFVRGAPNATALAEWSDPATTNKGSIRGWMPRLQVQFMVKNGGMYVHSAPMMASYEKRRFIGGIQQGTLDSLVYEDLGNHFYVNWPNDDTQPQPVPGDNFSFRVRPLDVSPTAPVWKVDHPADIVRDILIARGRTVVASSVTAARTAAGPYKLAIRISDPPTVAEGLAQIAGLTGISYRTNDDGTCSLFCWRTRRTPIGTITLDDLAERPPKLWGTDEASRVYSVRWKFARFDRWPGQDQDASGNDRPLDGITVFDEAPIEFVTGSTQPAESRTQEYAMQATLLRDNGGPIASLTDVVAPWAATTLNIYGDGAVTMELDLLPTIFPRIGDEVLVELGPIPGFDILLDPVAQRGIENRCLVIGHTPMPWGDRVTLLRIPSTGDAPEIPEPEEGTETTLDDAITASVGTPATSVVRLTLDDDTDWSGSGVSIEVQYKVQSTMPTGSGSTWPILWTPGASTFDLDGFTPGTKVWVRTRTLDTAASLVGDWGAWQDVTLDTATSTPPAGIVQRPAVAPDIDAGSGDVDLYLDVGPEVVKVYAAASLVGYPSVATILAGSTDVIAPFLFLSLQTVGVGQTGYIGVIAEDALGNQSLPAFVAVPRVTAAAPADAEYLALALNGTLTNERRFVPAARLVATDGGANGDYGLDLTNNVRDASIVIGFRNGAGLTAGDVEESPPMPFAGTILSWSILGGDAAGSIVFDVWKKAQALYPPTVADTITAAAKPTLTAARESNSSSLTGWTVAFAIGDVLMAKIDSVATLTRAKLTLQVRKS